MRKLTTAIVLCSAVFAAAPAFADVPLDCSKKSLAEAAANLSDKVAAVIEFTGTCSGPIVIRTDGITLQGVGGAIIDGGGHDAVTVAGAGRVALKDVDIRNGQNGLVALNGAHLTLSGVNIHDNAASGIVLHTGASAVLINVTTAENGLHGLDVRSGSVATVNESLIAAGNAVFGINVNGSSITFAEASVSATGNTLGIQIGTGANAFIADPGTVVTVNNNLATGLTIVSGSHMVSFGGTINASGNAGVGVSVNSKSGLDLDAGSMLNSSGNGDGVLVQQNSVMTVFNTPQFSGVPGFSTVSATNNTRTGVRILTDSVLTLASQARVVAMQNGTVGFVADNGATVTLLNSTLTGNTVSDMQLLFGTRADLRAPFTLGSYTCDATVLVRGTAAVACPH